MRVQWCFLTVATVGCLGMGAQTAAFAQFPAPELAPPAGIQSENPTPATPAQPDRPPITLGQNENEPYLVVIPTRRAEQLLERVQEYAPLAFASRSRLGRYILVQAFANRRPAERLSRQLRAAGFDARVTYAR